MHLQAAAADHHAGAVTLSDDCADSESACVMTPHAPDVTRTAAAQLPAQTSDQRLTLHV